MCSASKGAPKSVKKSTDDTIKLTCPEDHHTTSHTTIMSLEKLILSIKVPTPTSGK